MEFIFFIESPMVVCSESVTKTVFSAIAEQCLHNTEAFSALQTVLPVRRLGVAKWPEGDTAETSDLI